MNSVYDVVVVGSGPAGVGVVMSLLEHSDHSVAILEAGEYLKNEEPLMEWYPKAHSKQMKTGITSWNRRMRIPSGKGLGGGTNVNAGILMVDPDQDRIIQATSDQMLQRIESHGYLYRHQTMANPPWLKEITLLADGRGSRVSAWQALVEPYLQKNPHRRQQLKLHCHFTVSSVIHEDDGNFLVQDGMHLVRGQRIVLCAGAFGTPRILQSSGWAPDVMPGLQDHAGLAHVTVHRPLRRKANLSVNGVAHLQSIRIGNHQLQLLVMDSIPNWLPYLVSHDLCHKVFPTQIMANMVTLWLEWLLRLFVATNWSPLYLFLRYCITVVGVFHMNPTSQGCLYYGKENSIMVDLPYLQTVSDREALWEGHRRVPGQLRLLGWLSGWSLPLSRRCWEVYARGWCVPYFHWYNTSSLALQNLPTGLSICDASSLSSVSVPPSLTLLALGYRHGKTLVKPTND